MTQATIKDSKQQIMSAFNKLLTDYKQVESKIATKEEEAEKEKNKALIETVADYKVENIVNSMASLQLDFGNIVNQLADKLTGESSKLDELKRAILVETERLEELRKVRLVADALYLLRQEHQEKLRILQTNASNQKQNLEKTQEETRKIWNKEQQELELKNQEAAQVLAKKRQQEEADFNYKTQTRRQREMDEYQERRRLQEREIMEKNLENEKAWKEREKYLTDNQAEFEANQAKIAGFEEALKKAYNEAKGEAIKDADREAKIKSDLFEKEWEAAKLGYDFKIQSLDGVIQRQSEQMVELTNRLQTAITQAQNLALRAFQPNSNQ